MYRLIAILSVCMGMTCCGGNEAKKNERAEVLQEQVQEEKDRVGILYFHGRQRCATCIAIEKNTREVLERMFADELEKGTVVFRSIDISYAENEKIADKYEVVWSSLFICRWKDGIESRENLTAYAFANARTAPGLFRNGLAGKIDALL